MDAKGVNRMYFLRLQPTFWMYCWSEQACKQRRKQASKLCFGHHFFVPTYVNHMYFLRLPPTFWMYCWSEQACKQRRKQASELCFVPTYVNRMYFLCLQPTFWMYCWSKQACKQRRKQASKLCFVPTYVLQQPCQQFNWRCLVQQCYCIVADNGGQLLCRVRCILKS